MKSDKDCLIHCSTFFASNTYIIVISNSWKFLILIRVLILDQELSLLMLANSWDLTLLFIDSSLN